MKVFLRVPYEDRRKAKFAGAHWDPVNKKWYVLSRPEFMACQRWWPVVGDEVKSWLADTELTKYFGEVFANPHPETTSYEPDRLIRKIESAKTKARRERRAKHHPKQLPAGKAIRSRLARTPAGPFSDSPTLIRSITVKLPL